MGLYNLLSAVDTLAFIYIEKGGWKTDKTTPTWVTLSIFLIFIILGQNQIPKVYKHFHTNTKYSVCVKVFVPFLISYFVACLSHLNVSDH